MTRTRPSYTLLAAVLFLAACQGEPAGLARTPKSAPVAPASHVDPQRPQYHFLPARNWMNDPNGLIQVGDTYHLFYQHNPSGPLWGNMTWGHATSTDLVHWQHQPLALHPDQPYDKAGVFSGCIVTDGQTATAVYTGTNPKESQCIATSTDLIQWSKPADNPVIALPPPELGEVTGFRDPCVWKDGAIWNMAVGSGTRAGGGLVLLYTSPDLHRWTYRGPLFSGDRFTEMWECPNFFPLDGSWVLIVSAKGLAVAFTGDFADGRFTPRHRDLLDDGGSLYAPQVLGDSRGRRILFGWLTERRPDEAQRNAGWSGVQSLPRVLSLGTDGRLWYKPADEVSSLRARRISGPTGTISGDRLLPLGDIPGDRCEVIVTLATGAGTVFGLKVRQSPFAIEETLVSIDLASGQVSLDTGRSSLDRTVARDRRTTTIHLSPGRPITLRIFLDASVIELFADDQACLTGRIYPTRSDSQGISVFSDGADIKSCEVWEMSTIWPADR